MFISPYDTTVGKTLKNIDRVRAALEVAYVDKSLSGQGGVADAPLVELLDGKPGLDDIPSFGHPLAFNTVLDGRKLAVDQRAYARVPVNLEYAGSATDIRNAREYNFLAQRGWLQIGWETLGTATFERLSPIPLRVFCEWISGQVTKKLGLDAQQKRDLTVVCAWYYLCLFRPSLDEKDRVFMTRGIQSALRYDYNTVAIVTENLPYMSNMADFVSAAQNANISPRLRTLNPAVLFAITSFSWVGGYAKEVAGIALEHPPTFILMCLSGDDDRGYKDTILGQLMRDQRKLTRDVDDFRKNVQHFLETCRGVSKF